MVVGAINSRQHAMISVMGCGRGGGRGAAGSLSGISHALGSGLCCARMPTAAAAAAIESRGLGKGRHF